MYRDLGRVRTLHRLETVLKRDFPEIAVSHVTLDRWSKRHDWQKRIQAFERGIALGQAPAPVIIKLPKTGDDPLDRLDMLLRTANQALQRAMQATPAVTKPSDVKTLFDAAANAMKLVETLQSRQAGKDVEAIVRAAAQAAADARGQPIEPIFQAAALAAGLQIGVDGAPPAQVDAVPIEAAEHEGEQQEVMVQRVSQDVAQTTMSLRDVLAQVRFEQLTVAQAPAATILDE